jgi:hypothetical protein
MPYVVCAVCKLTSFSAAYRWQPDHCARCGAELPRPQTAGARASNPAWARAPRRDRDRDEPRPGTDLQDTRHSG